MRLTEILKPQNILVPMQAKTKNEAIGELVSLLAKNGEIQDAKAVLDSVLEREMTRTTGIGNGLAIQVFCTSFPLNRKHFAQNQQAVLSPFALRGVPERISL